MKLCRSQWILVFQVMMQSDCSCQVVTEGSSQTLLCPSRAGVEVVIPKTQIVQSLRMMVMEQLSGPTHAPRELFT